MKIEYIPTNSLESKKDNPRSITKNQFEKLCQNIKNDPKFFAMRPCLVNYTNGILEVYAGNQRLRAAKKIKMQQVPCIIEENVPEFLVKKRIILDNIHHGEHDYDLLAALYDVEELIDLGMTQKELDLTIESVANEAESEEKEKEAKCCPNCGYEL